MVHPPQGFNIAASQVTSGRFTLAMMPDGASGYVLTGQGTGVDPVYADPWTIGRLKNLVIMWS